MNQKPSKKRLLLRNLLAAIAILATPLGASAYDFEAVNDDNVTIYYNILTDTDDSHTVAVTYKSNSSSQENYYGIVNIPEKVTKDGTTYTVTSIGNNAFAFCGDLDKVIIPNSVTSIGSSAFYNCTGLYGELIIPDSVTSIGDNAFNYCSNLTSVTIGESVTSIGDNAFYNCWRINTVNYNAVNCTTTYPDVFQGASHITTLNIGENVTNIPDYLFKGVTSLKEINIANPYPPVFAENTFEGIDTQKVSVTVPEGSLWRYYSTVFEGDVAWTSFQHDQQLGSDMTFNDAEQFTSNRSLDNMNIDYIRTFTNDGVWQCLYIPFSLNYEDWEGKVDIAEFHYINYVHSGNVRISINFNELGEGSNTVANQPYLVKPKTTGAIEMMLKNKTLVAEPAEDAMKYPCDSNGPYYNYCLVGTYKELPAPYLYNSYNNPNLKAYVIGNDGFGVPTAKATLKAQRFFLLREAKPGVEASRLPQVSNISITVNNQDGTQTDITEMFVIDETGVYYDLLGNPVKNPEHGIYIKDGKKYIFK